MLNDVLMLKTTFVNHGSILKNNWEKILKTDNIFQGITLL